MTESTYNTLRARINRHCPHLLELRFGCEAIIEDDRIIKLLGDKIESSIYAKNKCEIYYLYDWEDGSSNNHMWCAFKDLKILGTPPTLQDVLMAIEISTSSGEKNGDIEFWFGEKYAAYPNNAGILYMHLPQAELGEGTKKYNLALPLKDQTEEVGQFLLSIISE